MRKLHERHAGRRFERLLVLRRLGWVELAIASLALLANLLRLQQSLDCFKGGIYANADAFRHLLGVDALRVARIQSSARFRTSPESCLGLRVPVLAGERAGSSGT